MTAKLARSQRTGAHEGAVHREGRSLLKVGDLLAGKYRVERVLGEGGMGVVVEAYHELLDQRVAVKLLYQDIADREAQSRLLMEARSAAKLQSEHVARVVDVDVGPDGLPFIVMELLEGADLCQLADAQGALPQWVVADYMLQACEGLAHAHGRGIVHRDLKPSNLFLATRPDGQQIIKILDFGISKSQGADDGRKLTGGGTVLGSPPYMSPEQIRSPKTIDHRTDIWSLGICMYELLTNSMPFGGEELQEAFAQILERQPTPIRALVPGVPEGLEQIVMTCLAKNRNDRFSDVSELAKALVPYGSGVWNGMGERVQAVLARALMEEVTSGTRLRGNVVTPDSLSLAIPSSPGRRLDSGNPELHGTAATVQRRRRSGWDSKRSLLVASAVVGGLGAFLIIAVSVYAKRTPGVVSDTDPSGPNNAPVVEPSPATQGAMPPAAAATGTVITGTALPPAPPPTIIVPPGMEPDPTVPPQAVLGVSPSPSPSPNTSVRALRPPPPARPAPPPVAPKKPAPSPAPSSGSKSGGLPPELQSRSGQ